MSTRRALDVLMSGPISRTQSAHRSLIQSPTGMQPLSMDLLAVSLFSRFAHRAGLVTQRQTFVRRCQSRKSGLAGRGLSAGAGRRVATVGVSRNVGNGLAQGAECTDGHTAADAALRYTHLRLIQEPTSDGRELAIKHRDLTFDGLGVGRDFSYQVAIFIYWRSAHRRKRNSNPSPDNHDWTCCRRPSRIRQSPCTGLALRESLWHLERFRLLTLARSRA